MAGRDGQEATDRLWLVLETLAVAHPDITLFDGLQLAQRVYAEVEWHASQGLVQPPTFAGPVPADPSDADAMAAWIDSVPSISALIASGKIIQAIKEVRSAHGSAGLKEAKDAVDRLRDMDPAKYPRVGPGSSL